MTSGLITTCCGLYGLLFLYYRHTNTHTYKLTDLQRNVTTTTTTAHPKTQRTIIKNHRHHQQQQEKQRQSKNK